MCLIANSCSGDQEKSTDSVCKLVFWRQQHNIDSEKYKLLWLPVCTLHSLWECGRRASKSRAEPSSWCAQHSSHWTVCALCCAVCSLQCAVSLSVCAVEKCKVAPWYNHCEAVCMWGGAPETGAAPWPWSPIPGYTNSPRAKIELLPFGGGQRLPHTFHTLFEIPNPNLSN